MEQAKANAPSPKSLAAWARKELSMLGVAFLLGMAVNLIGLPSETSGGAKTATSILLGLHGLVGIGLIVGAAMTVRQAMKVGASYTKLARAGGAAIGLTFVVGLVYMATESSWWSYMMAVGFLVAFFIYGKLMLRTAGKD
jgi:hypothetical protein